MNKVLHGLDFAYVYIDDLLIPSSSPEEHLEQLRLVFQRLNEHSIVINVPKSCFGVRELDFLGHHVDTTGIRPLEEKVQVIREFPTITTDRGGQFESNLWKAFTELLGSKHTRTTAYHPIANGMVERFHRQLKSSLKASPHPERWTDMLHLALLGIRTTLKEDLKCTAAELVYGTSLRLPGEFFTPHATPVADAASYIT